MSTVLKTLDRLEEFRQQIEESPIGYDGDYVVRVCEAIVAEEAGYAERGGWKQILSEPENGCEQLSQILCAKGSEKIVFCDEVLTL